MANDGTVKIGTELDQSGFKSGLSGLGGFASKGFGAVGGAAKAMAGVTVAALAAIGTGMGAAVVSGVKYNASMEMYTANFKTMLGSEAAAIAKVNELKKLGASTPFEMSDLATATTTLLAFGVSGSKSTQILTMLGDVSLGNADKLNRLSNSFGKVQSQGKLTGETAQMMIEAGFNPLKLISERTGESMAVLADRMSKGKVSADEVTAAFQKATSKGGQFYKGMETASVTFDGLVSTLKDNANALVGDVVKPISDSMTKTLLPEAIGMIGQLTTGFEKKGIPGLIDAAGSVVGKIIGGIAAQAPAVIKMASGFLTTLLNALMAQLPALSMAGIGIITSLMNAIITNLPLLFQLGMTLLTNLLFGIAVALPQMIPAMQAAIMTMVKILMDNLPLILAAGMAILVAIIQGIASMLPKLIEYLPALIDAVVDVIVENLPLIITTAIQILIALIKGLADAIPRLIEYIPEIITTIVDVLMDNLPMIIKTSIAILIALIQGLVAALPKLIDMVPTIIDTIITTLLDNLDLIVLCAIELVIALAMGLVQAIPKLIAYLPELITSIVEAFKRHDWGETGKNILDGIKGGITASAGKLADAALDAAKKAFQAVKNFFGIKSPSRRARDEIGKMIPEGAAIGVDENADVFADSSADASREAVAAMKDAASREMLNKMKGQAYSRTTGLSSSALAASVVAADQAYAYSNAWESSPFKAGNRTADTVVIPIYFGNQQFDEVVASAAENWAIKKNR